MEWKTIESAPKDGTTILLGTLDKDGVWSGGTFGRWTELRGWHRYNEPTHWMRLDPPKGTKIDDSL